jgi:hypothetical protein
MIKKNTIPLKRNTRATIKVISDLSVPTENQEQRALVKWVRSQHHICEYLIKITNEVHCTIGQGHNLNLLGRREGASDLFLAIPTSHSHGLWLEIKRNKPYSEKERSTHTWLAQEKFFNLMRLVGFEGHMAFGWENGKEIIENYLQS